MFYFRERSFVTSKQTGILSELILKMHRSQHSSIIKPTVEPALFPYRFFLVWLVLTDTQLFNRSRVNLPWFTPNFIEGKSVVEPLQHSELVVISAFGVWKNKNIA